MSNKNAPESCQQPAGEMKLQVNDQQMGYNNVWELFALSLYIKARQTLCSDTWPLLFPLTALLFNMASSFIFFRSLLKNTLPEKFYPFILYKITTPTTIMTYSPYIQLC